MEYRTLTVNLVSANGLKKTRFTRKTDVYAVVSISGTFGNGQKLRTSIHKNAVDSNPTWNSSMKFLVYESAGLQNQLTLVVKIKSMRMFVDKTLGEARVPIKELLEGVKPEGKAVQTVSYQVKPQGVVTFSYEFGEKIVEPPVTAYPPPATGGGYYTPQQQQQGGYAIAYPPPPPVQGYGGYPTQPVYQPQPRRSRMNNSGMGFGTGLMGGALGGLLIGDMMSHGGGGCGGGGCGGGGCGGGGCGGGGCGGF
ncbi:hypothetical protein SSX86_032849 [Deinandra increscens subsp. villosa]|uniref:C2 domain-containing protein n=1 Tax=Deinandra increscens subsp. villosa TaxID=3103831 RepID=A0AAP0C7B7_9ASTR